MRLGAECKHCNKKPEKFVNNYHADIHSLTALRLKIGFCGSGSVARMPEWAEWRHNRSFGIYALFHHNCEGSIRGCAHFKIAGV